MSQGGGKLRSLPGIAISFLMLIASGCRSADPNLYPRRVGDAPAEIIVLDNHWHTALIFRQDDLPNKLRSELRYIGDRRYVAIGWGDEGFFRASKITAGLVAQAMFYSRGSVMLVTGFDSEPEEMFDDVVDIYRVPTRPESLSRVIDAVSFSFAHKENRIIDAGPGIDFGRFYVARGRYGFENTCNHWTASRLADGGLPITPAYASSTWNLSFQLKLLDGVHD